MRRRCKEAIPLSMAKSPTRLFLANRAYPPAA